MGAGFVFDKDKAAVHNTVFTYIKIFLEKTNTCKLESWEVKNGEISFSVSRSVFAEAVEKSRKPVYIPLGGTIAGLLDELT